MNFREALKAAYEGKRIALPEWGGYWFVENGLLCVYTKEGEYTETPWFNKYCDRTDWFIIEK